MSEVSPELLARLDERTKSTYELVQNLTTDVKEMRQEFNGRITKLEDDTKERLQSFEDKFTANYVTKAEFNPVRSIVFGAAGFILISVLSALVYLVLSK